MYSQEDEEQVILANTPETGRFLDIGAYDGKTFSNTRALADRGWTGVWVEPAAWAFDLAAHDKPEGVELVNAVVGPETCLRQFLYCRDAVSTTSPQFSTIWASQTKYHPIHTMAISVNDLISYFATPFHFISIDCEGTTTEVLNLLRPHLDGLDTRLICVEREGNAPEVPGFSLIHTNTNNYILGRA